MERIGITGVAGLIGSHLSDRLLEKGYEIAGVDNLSIGTRDNLSQSLKNKRFSFIEKDVCDLDSMRKSLEGCDAIVHLAAHKIPRYGNRLEMLNVNARGCENALEVARENECRIYVASTSDVYGKNPDLPFSENSNLVMGSSEIARWAYAVSKMYDEHMAFAYMEKHGIPATVFRFFGTYGPRHHRSWRGGPPSVFINSLLKGEEIEIHGDGKQSRTFLYVSDLISGIVSAIESNTSGGEIFNLGSTNETTIIDFARTIHKIIDGEEELKLKFVPYSSFTGKKYEDVRRRVPDIKKAEEMLNFKVVTSVEEGLSKTIEWHRQALNKQD